MVSDEERRPATSELELAERRRDGAMTPIADVLDGYARSDGMSERMRSTWSVTRAWMTANGDYERRHTVGTFVDEKVPRGELPALVVYVDSKTCEVDLTANREIYLARLSSCGLNFSKIVFRLSKAEYIRRRDASRTSPKDATRAPLPELTAEEAEHVDRLCADLPESLRDSVSRAMRVSIRAQK